VGGAVEGESSSEVEEQQRALQLLDELWTEPQTWQPRLVYRVSLSTTTHARVEAHYQLVFPPDVLEAAGVPVADTPVRVLIPLTWRPKELLLNLALSSSEGGPVHLLTRAEVAALQSTILLNQLAETDLILIDIDGDDVQLLVEAVARFMPRRVRAAADLNEFSPVADVMTRLRDPDVLAAFLSTATRLAVRSEDVARWMDRLELLERILKALAPVAQPAESSSLNFVLALSELEPAPAQVEDLDYFVEVFRFVVLGLHVRDELRALRLLARLGSEWRVILDTEMPTSRPVSVLMADDRPLVALDPPDGCLRVPVPLADGSSMHVETQLLDPSAILKEVKIVSALGEEELFLSDDVRETDDRHAVYFSVAERPERALARIDIGLTSDVRWTNRSVMFLACAALIMSTLVDNDADILALLVIPATLAVSVVQVRERTSLVRRLTERTRRILFGVAIVLWLVAALRLLLQSPQAHGLYDLLLCILAKES
jgi:hypothetical protein